MRRLCLLLGLILSAIPVRAVEWSDADWRHLRALAVGERVTLELPTGRRDSRTAVLERFNPYAPDARIFVVDAGGTYEVPRSRRVYFLAKDGTHLALHMDADGSNIGGIAWVEGQLMELHGMPRANGGIQLQLKPMPTHSPNGESIDWTCGGSPHAGDALSDGSKLAMQLAVTARSVTSATRQAVVAVDTDNEFMLDKFADNTVNATDYLSNLFAGMNVLYEKTAASGGLELRLLQGHTILRVSGAADPYVQNQPFQQLVEFGGFWRNNLPGISRAFVMLLSGKSPSPNASSGTGWVVTSGSYCDATGAGAQNFGHYSVTQVFRFVGSNASHDVRVIAHELGHNLGAFHTHCTAVNGSGPTAVNTMDQCFSDENVGGVPCYSGSVSCPGGVGNPGTIMSYCHFNPPNCGQPLLSFHSGHVTALNNRIAANFPSCIKPLQDADIDLIFRSGFEVP